MLRSLAFIFIALLLITCSNSTENSTIKRTILSKEIDWQGHRGARGLSPENTIPSFLKALEFPITTLELDVVMSKDSQMIVSHEPWMSHHICNTLTKEVITKEEEEQFLIYNMTYEEIKKYDCGSRGNKRFSEQQKIKAYKPSLFDMITEVELFCKKNNRAEPNYNIEIKSRVEWDDIKTPKPERFAQVLLKELDALSIINRTTIQSFDVRSLKAVKLLNDTITTAYLVEQPNVAKNMASLGYLPEIYSPYYALLNEANIDSIHNIGMKIIPWTINDQETMQRLIKAGVDGIITDYPNLIP